ncbi:MAG: type II toxin-antitoxin system RelE/ParE family toxin [Actinomycetota bacterium]|nr:type II toxin-antitoxin system RelE/ParE family toxin [Actinomycetota bacterium]
MTYSVTLAPAAIRQLKKLAGGSGEWRVRTGDYRVVYEIHDDARLVLVLAVGHRRDIHRSEPAASL